MYLTVPENAIPIYKLVVLEEICIISQINAFRFILFFETQYNHPKEPMPHSHLPSNMLCLIIPVSAII
jgi:hypothetical protein